MADLKAFREKVDDYRLQAGIKSKEKKDKERQGMSQQDLADACGYTRSELNRQLNGKSPMSPMLVKQIVKVLAERHGIRTKSQAKELLALMDVPDFSPVDWNGFPLNLLETEGQGMELESSIYLAAEQNLHSDTTELTMPSRIERQPISQRALFEAVRRRRVVYLVIAAVFLVMLVVFMLMTTSWAKSNKVTISGKVLCIDNERMIGVWVSAANGGSGFAHWYKTNSNGSEAAFRYDLPNGGTYNIHVGCGGSTQDWENTDYTENGSGTIKDHNSHYFTCQDLPLVTGHGPCYLRQ